MALNVINLPRIFKLPDGTILQDPNALWAPEEVIKHYCSLYPEITNGSFEKIEKQDHKGVPSVIYTISRNPGKLG